MFNKEYLEEDGEGFARILNTSEIANSDSQAYILNHEQEKIYCIIRDDSHEYCFTNLALIMLYYSDESIVNVYRYDYEFYDFDSVFFKVDEEESCAISFNLYNKEENDEIEIIGNLDQVVELRNLYKTLITIGNKQAENKVSYELTIAAQNLAESSLKGTTNNDNMVGNFINIRENAAEYLNQSYRKYHQKDFGIVFREYLI